MPPHLFVGAKTGENGLTGSKEIDYRFTSFFERLPEFQEHFRREDREVVRLFCMPDEFPEDDLRFRIGNLIFAVVPEVPAAE